MLRFLHAADLHLDSHFRSLPPERAIQRRAELRALPGLLCDLAREQDCQLLLLSGDLFDAVGGYPETIEALIRAFSACPAQISSPPATTISTPPPVPTSWSAGRRMSISSVLRPRRPFPCRIWASRSGAPPSEGSTQSPCSPAFTRPRTGRSI